MGLINVRLFCRKKRRQKVDPSCCPNDNIITGNEEFSCDTGEAKTVGRPVDSRRRAAQNVEPFNFLRHMSTKTHLNPNVCGLHVTSHTILGGFGAL